MRNFFSLLVRLGNLEAAEQFATQRAVPYFEAMEMENSAHKMLVSVTVMQLHRGDVGKVHYWLK